MSDQQEKHIRQLMTSTDGKQKIRTVLQALSVPLSGSPITAPIGQLLSAGSGIWAEIEQGRLNRKMFEELGAQKAAIDVLFEHLSKELQKPDGTDLQSVLTDVIGGQMSSDLLSGRIGRVSVLLNERTYEELVPYQDLGLLLIESTGSTAPIGANHSVGQHTEDKKRNRGFGEVFILTVPDTVPDR